MLIKIILIFIILIIIYVKIKKSFKNRKLYRNLYRCRLCQSIIYVSGLHKKKEITITCSKCKRRIRISYKNRIYPKGIFKKILSLTGKK